MLTIGSLFSGIGGLELGLEWAGLGPVRWQVEQEEFCRGILAKHWPAATRHVDVRAVGAGNLEPVDIICGGFPCQDISVAGKGAGLAGARSGLWFEFARIVGELRPRLVVVENVAALATRGLDVVVGDLSALGYDAWWSTVRASDVGAPHRRERLFIVGWMADGASVNVARTERRGGFGGRPKAATGDGGGGSCVVAHGNGERRIGEREPEHGDEQRASGRVADGRGARRRRNGATLADATHGGIRRGRASGSEGLAARGDEGVADAAGPRRDGAEVGGGHRAAAGGGSRDGESQRTGAGVGDADLARLEGRNIDRLGAGECAAREAGSADASDGRAEPGMGRDVDGIPTWLDRWPAGPGSPQHEWEPPRVATGIPNRARRLKSLGNAVVPQVAEVIGHVLLAIARSASVAARREA